MYSYKKLLAAGDSSYITYFSIGVCAEQLSRYDDQPLGDKVNLQVEAVDYLKRAVAVSDSAQAAPFYHLGNLYNEMKNYQESEKCFQKAIQLLSPDPSVMNICWSGLAESLYCTGQYERAAHAFETALSFHSQSITSLYYLSICYEGYGDYAKAKAQFENFLNKAYTIDNPSENLKQMIADAKQRLSRLK
ncbi:MAG: tetratricopeptide repeat protein [Prevotella sp.]